MKNRNRIILALAVVAAAFPLLLVEMPVIMDYTNHLARIWILSGGNSSGPLTPMYQSAWTQASTNIAVDVFGAFWAHFLSISIVNKILLTLMFIGPPIGAAFLNRSLFKEINPWQISFFILTWTTTSIAGFLSYQIGVFAAFLAAGIDHQVPGSSFSFFLRRTITGALLLTIHPFALLFFVILVAGLIIDEKPIMPFERARLVKCAKSLSMLAVAAAIPLLILFLLAPHHPLSFNSTEKFIHWHISAKTIFRSILSPFMTYQGAIDILLTASIFAVLVWSAFSKRIKAHRGLLISAGIFFLLTIFSPKSIGDASWLQRRFPLMAILTLMAAVKPDIGLTRPREILLSALLLATLWIRAGWIANIWIERQSDLQSLYAATNNVPAGSSILPIQHMPLDWKEAPPGRIIVGAPGKKIIPVERHFPSLLVIKKQVFIPTLFSIPGQHALKVLPPWNEISVRFSGIPSMEDFIFPTKKIIKSDPYLLQWRSRFDYVLVINADLQPLVVPGGLKLEKNSGFAKLYRVIH